MKKNSKENKIFQNLSKMVEQFMRGRGFTPQTEKELIQKLYIPKIHQKIFNDVLLSLIKKDIVEFVNKKYRIKSSNTEFVTGVLKVHPRGFGFLQADDKQLCPQDVFIPKQLTGNGVDGDRVEVQINQDVISEKGPEGRVIAIIERTRTHVAGIIRRIEPKGNAIAYVPMLGVSQRVVVHQNPEFDIQIGDRVVMEVVDWGSKNTETTAAVSHHIGHISDPSCDIKAAVEEYELRAQFPSNALKEAEKIGKIPQSEIKKRLDLRAEPCLTIDPTTAKDFDDAISIKKDKNDHYRLGVHIADASFFITPGSALDKEARTRANSVYFPGECLPMLPPNLSENIISLKPNVNRLAVSVLMHFDPEGNLLDYKIARSVIKSAKRLTYSDAKNIIDGKKKSPHVKEINLMVEMCLLLKKKRSERGSLEFAIPELRIVVDANGIPLSTEYIAYDITHQMIEEFMLKTNETIARHLSDKGIELPYRVHDVPSEENMKEFSTIARAFGFKLSNKPTPKELQDFFDEALTTPFGEYLAVSYIRRMQQAVYSPDNIGHYGLGLSHYCHFTSPIRRYIDFTIHRILFEELEVDENLKQTSRLCSEQERVSARAENSVILLKKLRLLDAFHRKNKHNQYKAVVTQVKNFGITFEVLDFMLEGFLHVSDLENDYFVFDEDKSRLRGKETGFTYRTGDKITVMLQDVDFIFLETKWYIIEKGRKKLPKRRNSKKRKGR